jgi:hypothetical protein
LGYNVQPVQNISGGLFSEFAQFGEVGSAPIGPEAKAVVLFPGDVTKADIIP